VLLPIFVGTLAADNEGELNGLGLFCAMANVFRTKCFAFEQNSSGVPREDIPTALILARVLGNSPDVWRNVLAA
jgi:hypothetical protein